MAAAIRHGDRPAVRRLLAALGLGLVSLAGLVSCDDDEAASNSLSPGEHTLTGVFKDTSDMKLPPPTFPWETTLDLGADQWCVTRVTIDGVAVSIPNGKACALLASGQASSVPLGTSSRGSVFAIYAPDRSAAGVGMEGESNETEGSASWSQEGPLILVLLDGAAHGTIQLVDAERRSTDVPVG